MKSKQTVQGALAFLLPFILHLFLHLVIQKTPLASDAILAILWATEGESNRAHASDPTTRYTTERAIERRPERSEDRNDKG
ncbi:hypothetical protein BDV97DRAFT_360627 [Delphinella strobiligena]|nr:hypothetical protein BDV97DRAFT_360627 [Delphinella strobiligena]